MTLAEAIRLGGTLSSSQTRGSLFHVLGGTCALGGAGLAVGLALTGNQDFWRDLRCALPELNQGLLNACPVCGARRNCGFDTQYVVIHLNDEHYWTRDQIADFVESLVPPAPSGPVIEAAECAAALEVPA